MNLLMNINFLSEVIPYIHYHKERWDGKGEPEGLSGNSIPFGSRIIAVADSFDAMISNRTYRRGLGFEKTMEELQKGKNTQFDGKIVETLQRYVEKLGREQFEATYCIHIR